MMRIDPRISSPKDFGLASSVTFQEEGLCPWLPDSSYTTLTFMKHERMAAIIFKGHGIMPGSEAYNQKVSSQCEGGTGDAETGEGGSSFKKKVIGIPRYQHISVYGDGESEPT